MKSILFTNAKLKGQNGLQDIYITDGKFKEIGPGLAAKVTAEKVVDLEGKLAVPPYVDPHIHLDYVFTALNPAAANKTGSLFEGIQRWSETKGRLTKEEIKEKSIDLECVNRANEKPHLFADQFSVKPKTHKSVASVWAVKL